MAHGITLKLRQIVQHTLFIPAREWQKAHEDQIIAGDMPGGRLGSSYRAARRNGLRRLKKVLNRGGHF